MNHKYYIKTSSSLETIIRLFVSCIKRLPSSSLLHKSRVIATSGDIFHETAPSLYCWDYSPYSLTSSCFYWFQLKPWDGITKRKRLQNSHLSIFRKTFKDWSNMKWYLNTVFTGQSDIFLLLNSWIQPTEMFYEIAVDICQLTNFSWN